MKKRPEKVVHTQIEQPIDTRRHVLQTAIDMIRLQKRHQNLIRIRDEKDATYASFRKILGNIKNLTREIRVHELPLEAEDIRRLPGMKPHRIVAPSVSKKPTGTIEKKKPGPQRSSLDIQLDALQQKLRSL